MRSAEGRVLFAHALTAGPGFSVMGVLCTTPIDAAQQTPAKDLHMVLSHDKRTALETL